MNILICYDISDNKRRRKVYKLLESYGIRTQYSIFELEVNKFEKDNIKEKILNILDQETDRIYFFTLCKECKEKIDRIGNYEIFKIEEYKKDVIFI
jgi:CRISPR-associated protein Cas2